MCDISPEVKEELRKFRFAKNNESSALICKLQSVPVFLCYEVLIFFLNHFSEGWSWKAINCGRRVPWGSQCRGAAGNLRHFHASAISHCIRLTNSTGTASGAPTEIYRLLLQNGARRSHIISNVFYLLHTSRFHGKLMTSGFSLKRSYLVLLDGTASSLRTQ